MKPSVREAFVPFNAKFEGYVPPSIGVPWMYPDLKNLVSVAIGNLIDPVSTALMLPFLHEDGSPATRSEIQAEWQKMKTLPPDEHGVSAAHRGHTYARKWATLFLSNDAISDLVMGKLMANEAFIKTIFTEYEDWPADAQLGVLSMTWAVGAAFQRTWPRFTAALHERDWLVASVECYMPEADHPLHGNPAISGLRPRNAANKTLFLNALASSKGGLDPETLFYPAALDPVE